MHSKVDYLVGLGVSVVPSLPLLRVQGFKMFGYPPLVVHDKLSK